MHCLFFSSIACESYTFGLDHFFFSFAILAAFYLTHVIRAWQVLRDGQAIQIQGLWVRRRKILSMLENSLYFIVSILFAVLLRFEISIWWICVPMQIAILLAMINTNAKSPSNITFHTLSKVILVIRYLLC